MKKIFCLMAALIVATSLSWADEGMWLLPLLQKMNASQLSEAGCRLTPDQIYSINHSSLKDAIVQFGGGCTGEIVSDEGLLLTNHHCGYSAIQKLSSVDHDYLKDGYWAMTRSEELPAEGLSVTFLESMTDVTDMLAKVEKKVRKSCKDSAMVENEVNQALAQAKKDLIMGVEAAVPGSEAEIESFYNSNVFYLICYKTYSDIRFVGAPPSSIGKFGADTDNWMWPRHTGDFSMFRVYCAPDGSPAEYSADNVPYRPKQHLKISLKGVQEGDYTMIMGYPGRTTRFQTSPQLGLQIEQNDIRIAARTIRQDIMMKHMLADPAVKIQYASKYSGSSNGWKKWKGMKIAFGKLDIIGRAENEEAQFDEWVAKCPVRTRKYGTAVADIKAAVEGSRDMAKAYTLSLETLNNIEIMRLASRYNNTAHKMMTEGTDTLSALLHAVDMMDVLYKDYNADIDREVTAALLKFYRDNARPEDMLTGLPEDFMTLDIDAYVDRLFEQSVFTSREKLRAAAGEGLFRDDPAFKLAVACYRVIMAKQSGLRQLSGRISAAEKTYTAGLLEWRKKQPSYPDANFTMRLTYGHVLSYSPADAIQYRYYTTLDGVMEKEDPSNWEFVVPQRLKEIWQTKDFGDYAMADGRMPVCFLSNNDITGGNSGSPIMNADGELLGLAFDGNWESMSSDVMFEPDLQRCINVDIRYVLMIIDKFGGAGYLVDEMDIVK